jgi:hypothetical protein
MFPGGPIMQLAGFKAERVDLRGTFVKPDGPNQWREEADKPVRLTTEPAARIMASADEARQGMSAA